MTSMRVYTDNHLTPEPWMASGSCLTANPDAFFPEQGGSTVDVKAICATCDVQAQCFAYSLEHRERFGIWGGVSERQRRRLLKGQP